MSSIIVNGYDNLITDSVSIVQAVEVIPLEVTDQSMLNGIKKIVCVDSCFVIQDMSLELYRFDKNGKFLNRISKRGRGSEEYLRLNTFCVDSLGHVALFDSFRHRILVFLLDGSFIDVLKLPEEVLYEIHDVAIIAPDRIFASHSILGDYNEVYSTIVLPSGERAVVHKTPMTTAGTGEYIGSHPIADYNQIKCILPFDNRIYRLNEEMELEELFTVSVSAPIPNRKMLARQTDFSIFTSVNFDAKGYFRGFTNLFETSDHYLLTYYDLYYFLIDKQAMTGLHVTNDNLSFPFVNLCTSIANELIGYMDETSVLRFPELGKYYSSDQGDNPYLIRYILK